MVSVQAEVGLLVLGNNRERDPIAPPDPLGRFKRGYTGPAMVLLEGKWGWSVVAEDQVVGIVGILVALYKVTWTSDVRSLIF